MPNWTKSQKEAIENTKGGNLIISASAGSGKTTTMVERAITLIKQGVPLKRILMLTFSEKAAAEIKAKMRKKLTEYTLDAVGDEKEVMRAQLDEIAETDISTIDAFCRKIVKDGFELIEGLNPTFDIADEGAVAVLRNKAMTDLFKEWDKKEDADYNKLREIFSLRSEEGLMSLVGGLYNFITVQVNHTGFLDEIYKKYSECKEDKSKYSSLAAVENYVKLVTNKAKEIKKAFLEYISKEFPSSIVNPNIDSFPSPLPKNPSPQEVAQYDISYMSWVLTEIENCQSLKDLFLTAKKFEENNNFKWKSVSKNDLMTNGVLDGQLKIIQSTFYKKVSEFRKELIETFERYEHFEDIEADHEKNLPLLKVIFDLVKEFDKKFTAYKKKENLVDYGDLEYYATLILNNEEKKTEFNDKYDYIFIDECQDTNYIQDEMMCQIAGNRTKLFMVGDVKQCIYRFRLAEPSLFNSRFLDYDGKGDAIRFRENFRSDPKILHFVNQIFGKIMTEEFGAVDYDTASFPTDTEFSKVESDHPVVTVYDYRYPDLEKNTQKGLYSVKDANIQGTYGKGYFEAKAVCEEIENLVGKVKIKDKQVVEGSKTGETVEIERYIEYKDIVIMTRGRGEIINTVIEKLIASGIPVDMSNITLDGTTRSVDTLIDLIKVLSNSRQDYPLISVMRSAIGGFTDDELALIKMGESKNSPFSENIKYGEYFMSVLEMAKEDSELGKKIKSFLDFIAKYRIRSGYTPLLQLINEILDTSGWRSAILSQVGGDAEMQSIYDYLDSFSPDITRSLSSFADYIDNYDEYKGNNSLSAKDNQVTCMTMHASKGLEFPVVFLVGCATHWKQDSSSFKVHKDYGVGIQTYDADNRTKQSNIIYKSIGMVKRRDELEDAMRLLYVAMTRPKNYLIITAESKEDAKFCLYPSAATNFLDWINFGMQADPQCAKYHTISVNLEEKEAKTKIDDKASLNLREEAEGKTIQSINKPYKYSADTELSVKYSVTALNTNATGEEVLPQLFTEDKAQKVGIEYHKILQNIDYNATTEEDVIAELNRLYSEGIIGEDTRDNADTKAIIQCLTSQIISYARDNKCYKERRFMLWKKAKELIDTQSDDNVLLQGVIDLVIIGEDKGGENIIVDFKKSHLGDEDLRIKYTKQLALYKEGVEKIFGIKVHRTILYVIGANREVEVIC